MTSLILYDVKLKSLMPNNRICALLRELQSNDMIPFSIKITEFPAKLFFIHN